MAVITDERLGRVAISMLNSPGDERIGQAIGERGVIGAIEYWRAGQGPSVICARINSTLERAEATLAQAIAAGFAFIAPGDSQWPAQLSDLDTQMPVGLWIRGAHDLAQLCAQSVAVVGARACTAYGERIASELGTMAADADQCVVSGAAFGIDAAAHRGALAAQGFTVAILACGVDVAYPAAHKGLLDRIAGEGLLVSELPLGALARKQHFLIRNRLIAALGQQTVVVEAALRSGSLSTANWANALGRTVWGIPGPITSASSAGVHREIASGQANLAMDLDSIFNELLQV